VLLVVVELQEVCSVVLSIFNNLIKGGCPWPKGGDFISVFEARAAVEFFVAKVLKLINC